MKKSIEALKMMIGMLKVAIQKSDEAEAKYESAPENEDYEKAFDFAYQTECKLRAAMASEIVNLIHVDNCTALKMTYNPRLENIIEKAI